MAIGRKFFILVAAVILINCGSTPTAPVTTLGGRWTGPMRYDNGQFQRADIVTVSLTQAGAIVTGTWDTRATWRGIVSGTYLDGTFTGTFTIDVPSYNPAVRCTGAAAVNGTYRSKLLSLNSPKFDGNCSGMPANITWRLSQS